MVVYMRKSVQGNKGLLVSLWPQGHLQACHIAKVQGNNTRASAEST